MLNPPLEKLTKRSDYLAAAKTDVRWIAPAFILQIYARPHEVTARYGITASRKVGGAVQRNFAKRRLRTLVRTLLASHTRSGTDYVLIARPPLLKLPFAQITHDLKKALTTLQK